ncbi:MAG TPA: ATP-binding protein [Thermoanaerobaculia bacterium]|nr:ATP-binding protein [Thermoanaerobaculia bacterium]
MPSPRLHRAPSLLLLVAALVAAALVAALGALSAAREVATFQPLGFAAAPAAGAFRVTAVDDPATGLAVGDLVLMADGAEPAGAADLARRLRDGAGSELLVMRDAEIVPVAYRRPGLDVDWPYLVLALIGAAYLGIGLYTLLKDKGGASRLFYAWCLASAALYLFTHGTLDEVGRLLYLADMVARLTLPPLTLHLFLVFPTPLARGVRRVVPFLYLPAALLLVVQVDLIAFSGRWLTGGDLRRGTRLWDDVELVHLAAMAVAAVAVLAVRLARPAAGAEGREAARQLRWITVGLAGGYLPFLALYLPPALAGVALPEALVAASVVPLGLVPLTFAYAILRYKLWDIEVILRDTVSATLTLLLGVIGFSLANLAIGRGVPEDLPLVRNLLVFAAGLGLAAVLVPTRRGIAEGLERLQYGPAYGKRRALVAFGRELLHERDLDRLCGRLLAGIEEAVGVDRATLYLARGEVLAAVRSEPGVPARLTADAFGERLWSEEVRRLEGVALPVPSAEPAQRLYAAGYRYLLPLTVRRQKVGLVAVGYKGEDLLLSSDDVDLLRQLLDQAALAIENARLMGELSLRLEEVSRLQRWNEGIIESSPAGIAVLDGGGRIVSANQVFADLSGRRREELIGRPLADCLPAVALPAPGTGPHEVAWCETTGRERYLQVSVSAFSAADGPGRILVVHDVSERVAMEAALKEKDRLAALGVMAAGVAHEVNTPLTGISSYAQMLLADTPEDDPRRELLRKVERQTFRASKIVNSLLDFARSRKGELAEVDLAAVVGECVDLLRERLVRRGVRVTWNPPAAGGIVVGDAGELQQVVTNLLLNAHDAMDGGGRLDLELVAEDGRVRLVVADTGVGIAPELLPRVFEPFVTTKLGHGGTGLGLAISHEIVRHHGGELQVESAPGDGARFTLTLPAAPAGGAAADGGGPTTTR